MREALALDECVGRHAQHTLHRPSISQCHPTSRPRYRRVKEAAVAARGQVPQVLRDYLDDAYHIAGGGDLAVLEVTRDFTH